MKNTENYGLNKPENTDFFNVEDFNGNMDILDEKLYESSHYEGNISSSYDYETGDFMFWSGDEGKIWTNQGALKTIYSAVCNIAQNGVFRNKERIDKIESDLSHIGMIIHSTTLDTEDKVKKVYGGVSWSKIEGRFLLGQSAGYAIGSTGGVASVTLGVSQMPSHAHGMLHTHTTPAMNTGNQSQNHTHIVNGGSCTITSSGAHSHTVNRAQNANAGDNRYAIQGTDDTSNVSVNGNGAHTHTVPNHTHSVGVNSANHTHTIPEGVTSGSRSATDTVGGGLAHENMPPYKTVYIWERTA